MTKQSLLFEMVDQKVYVSNFVQHAFSTDAIVE